MNTRTLIWIAAGAMAWMFLAFTIPGLVLLLALAASVWLPFELIVAGGQDRQKKRMRLGISVALIVGAILVVNALGTIILGLGIAVLVTPIALIIQFVRFSKASIEHPAGRPR